MGLFGKKNENGIFSELGGNDKSPLTPQGGLLLAAMTMAEIDGDLHDDEHSIITRLDSNSRKDDWDSAMTIKDSKTVDECIAVSAAAMDSEQQLVAIANLIDIAMADGTLADEEKLLLEKFLKVFDVDESEVRQIVHVISIKNNKSLF